MSSRVVAVKKLAATAAAGVACLHSMLGVYNSHRTDIRVRDRDLTTSQLRELGSAELKITEDSRMGRPGLHVACSMVQLSVRQQQ
jgi:hypothetical protein